MPRYEYKVVPAPRAPVRVRGIRGSDARFAFTIEEAINVAAQDGWDYLRAETLPCQHGGWFSRRTEPETVLVFRRATDAAGERPMLPPEPAMPPEPAAHVPAAPPPEPRLSADRDAGPRRATFASLRAAPADGRGGDRR